VRWASGLDNIDDDQVVTFGELERGDVDLARFADAIVLVGVADPVHASTVETPVGRVPPVFVHANAVNTLLTRQYASTVPSWPFTMATALVCVMVASLPYRHTLLRWGLVAAVVSGSFGIVAALGRSGRVAPAVLLPLGAIAAAITVEIVRQVVASAERRRLRALFSAYVPATVAQQLVESGRAEQATAGERHEVTALFCDLRGFTPLAGQLDPGQVRELLNTYYRELGSILFDEGGTILQYTGDEIFAVFGAPVPASDHPERALQCARRMFASLPALNQALAEHGLPAVNFGIGLHSGDVVAAHVGSDARMQYSVIGDTINVGSRHCRMAREGQIVVSAATTARLGTLDDAERIEDVEFKGLADRRVAFRIQAGPQATSGSPLLS
jgi:adenylate cyclase